MLKDEYLNKLLEDKGSWDRAYELYEIIRKNINTLDSELENSVESETNGLKKRIEAYENAMNIVCNVLDLHSKQLINNMFEELSVEDIILKAAGEKAIEKYNIRRKKIKVEKKESSLSGPVPMQEYEERDCVLIKTYENEENEIGMAFDIDSYLICSLPWARAYFKSPEKFIIGEKGSCQHIYKDAVVDNKGNILPINERKAEVTGKEALFHSISTLLQELINWEDGVGHSFESFDAHIFTQSYKSLKGKLNLKETENLAGAFNIVGERIINSLLATVNNIYDDEIYENSRKNSLNQMTIKLIEFLKTTGTNLSQYNLEEKDITSIQKAFFSPIGTMIDNGDHIKAIKYIKNDYLKEIASVLGKKDFYIDEYLQEIKNLTGNELSNEAVQDCYSYFIKADWLDALKIVKEVSKIPLNKENIFNLIGFHTDLSLFIKNPDFEKINDIVQLGYNILYTWEAYFIKKDELDKEICKNQTHAPDYLFDEIDFVCGELRNGNCDYITLAEHLSNLVMKEITHPDSLELSGESSRIINCIRKIEDVLDLKFTLV
ncbi:MAG: hypothetical protein PHW96_04755 [Candidatus Nanoarchaeia archaeon]|nr:hypothetical protein [Candidatus Nanoarchaeia archaeon]